MKRARPPVDSEYQRALQEAVRKSFSVEEQKRNAEHEAQVNRLLRNLDDFEKGRDDDRPAA